MRNFLLKIQIVLFFSVQWGSLWAEDGRDRLNAVIGKMNSLESFRASVTLNGGLTGVVSYKSPNQLHVRFSDGRIISSNGRILWFYNPDSSIAGKQDLKGVSGGLGGLLSGYENVTVSGRTFRLTSTTKRFNEIILVVSENDLPRVLKMKRSDEEITEIAFSGIATNIGLGTGLFNFQPPTSSQIVENPLNQKE
ncbi:LolA family protein [Leptospira limi]|uniref:Outer membrane lipoprotein carrier protein LolA n=1 Tax=Leptospira limi TaxID=2950023 RepID=A0ABT3LWG4_9LEPT|nr:outer membrane lipoprotein carrier protein LolA [Leptospira limi]MCW7462072.1 outer membrane lipoprotein carrier protein LolA [Leptospira limi]